MNSAKILTAFLLVVSSVFVSGDLMIVLAIVSNLLAAAFAIFFVSFVRQIAKLTPEEIRATKR